MMLIFIKNKLYYIIVVIVTFYIGAVATTLQYQAGPPLESQRALPGLEWGFKNVFCGSPSFTGMDTANAGLRLSCDEMAALEKSAMSGSSDAANKLALFFSEIQNDKKLSIYWLTIAAENGDKNAMLRLSKMLSQSAQDSGETNDLYVVRSKYWDDLSR